MARKKPNQTPSEAFYDGEDRLRTIAWGGDGIPPAETYIIETVQPNDDILFDRSEHYSSYVGTPSDPPLDIGGPPAGDGDD